VIVIDRGIDCGVDESERDGILVVSAILSKTTMMQKLTRFWSSDLHRMGVEFFHAKEHWNSRAKPYNGLSMQKRRELLDCLCGHISNYIEFGVSLEVKLAEYKALTSARFRSHFGSPYTMAIQILLIVIHRDLWERKQSGEPVNILLEQGPHIYQAMELLKERNMGNPEAFVHINSVGEGAKLGNPVLQAADLLAFGWSEYIKSTRSTMLSKIAQHRPKRFPCIQWRPELIEELKKGINEEIARRRYLNVPPLRRGLKPLLKGPDYESALAKRPMRS
jgi:hypothetical protein